MQPCGSRVQLQAVGSAPKRGRAAGMSRSRLRDHGSVACSQGAISSRWPRRPRRSCPGGWTRALRAAAPDAGRPAALRAARQRHARPRHRHPRAARAAAVPRAVGQPRRRRGEGPGAAPHRPRPSRSLQDPAGLGRGLRADLGGFRRAGQELRPARRARPHRHHREGDPRRARRPRRVPRRRRHLAEQLHVAGQQGPGHGRLHGAAASPTP